MQEAHFEAIDAISEDDGKAIALRHNYTDAEILNEARRRGLFSRVEAESLVPLRYLAQGYPPEQQMARALHDAVEELLREMHLTGKQPMGLKVENVEHPSAGDCRRLKFALNVVVERKK